LGWRVFQELAMILQPDALRAWELFTHSGGWLRTLSPPQLTLNSPFRPRAQTFSSLKLKLKARKALRLETTAVGFNLQLIQVPQRPHSNRAPHLESS
jgi:hypothetical protein